MDQWRDAQFYGLCTAAVLILEHVVLHWNWICGVIATKVVRTKYHADEGSQALYGIATFIGILTLMMAGILAGMVMVRHPPP